MLSTITWSGAGDGTTWSSPTNWTGGVVPGSSDDAKINVNNSVTIRLPAVGITVNSVAQTGGTLIASSGTITTTAGLTVRSGTFSLNGGSISGPATIDSSTLNLDGSAGGADFVIAGVSTISGTITASQTVRVEGGIDYEADLTLAQGASNLGSILLQSANGNNYASNLIAASGSTFTNTGNIEVNVSISPSHLTGSFTNTGTLTVDSGAKLIVGTAGLTFTQQSGTLAVPGTFVCNTGTLLIAGGIVSGSVIADGSLLQMANSITLPTTVYTAGSTTLIGNDSTQATVHVEGGIDYESDLTINPGAVNIGLILLQSANANNYASNLIAASGSTFTNTGNIEVNVSISPSHLTGSFTNTGTLTVDSGAKLIVGTAGLTFTQQSGTLAVPGTFVCNTGTLLIAGGIVSGSVIADGSLLQMANSITLPTTVYTAGSTTLLGNDSTQATVHVEGGIDYESDLTINPGAVNIGLILLQSAIGNNYASNLIAASGSTFTNTGSIEVNVSISPSHLTGSFTNTGTLTVDSGAKLIVGTAGLTFTQQSGTLAVPGTFVCNTGTLLIAGGIVSGSVIADGSLLQMANSITLPTTVYTAGSTTLLGNDSTQATVQVEGGLDYESDLTINPGAANIGTIVLQSAIGNNYASNLIAASGSTFTNGGIIQVNLSVSPSHFTGRFSNQGTIDINGTTLTLSGSGTTLTNLSGGVINALGTLDDSGTSTSFSNAGTLSIGNDVVGLLTINGPYIQTSSGALNIKLGGTSAGTLFDQLKVTGQAILAGSLNVLLINGYQPNSNDSFKVLTYASVSNMFTSYNGTNLSSGLILEPSQSTTNLTLTAVIAPQADLNVSVVATPGSVTIGGTFTYLVTVTNNGPNDAPGVVLVDMLPLGVTPSSILPSSGTLSTAGNQVTVNFNTLTSGSSDTLKIVETPTATGIFHNSATANSSGSYDPNESNNSDSATAMVLPPPSADLAVGLAGPPTSTSINTLTFVTTVTNFGPNDAAGSYLVNTFALPAGAVLSFDSVSQGSVSLVGSKFTVNFGTIPAFETATLTVIVTASKNGSYGDSANVTTSTADPVPGNNSASTSFSVRGQDSTGLSLSTSSSSLNRPLTLTSQIFVPTGFVKPTGLVTFFDGSVRLGSATLNSSGIGSMAVSTLTLGTHSISVTYAGDSNYGPGQSFPASVYVGDGVKNDFDGDGKADLAVFGKDPLTGRYDFRIHTSSSQCTTTIKYDNNGYGFGNASSIPVPADYFGDGRSAYALWTPNSLGGMTFTAVSSVTNQVISFNFGGTKDIPVVADVDGDGKADFGVFGYQPGLGYRFDFLLSSKGFNPTSQYVFNNNGYGYGNANSIPVVADFDGNGHADLGLFSPSIFGSTFSYVDAVTQYGFTSKVVGTPNDIPMAVDIDGDGKADFELYGPAPNQTNHYRYLILTAASGFSTSNLITFDNNGYGYGNSGSIPVIADYDGTGKADFGVFTPDYRGGMEFVYQTSQPGLGLGDFATLTDLPLTAPTYFLAKKVRGS